MGSFGLAYLPALRQVRRPTSAGSAAGRLSVEILAVAVAVGEAAAAWAWVIRRGRRDEKAEERVLLDHRPDRIVLCLENYFETVLLIGGIAFQQPLGRVLA